MNYLILKQVHIGFAIVSLASFVLRWIWKSTGTSLLQHRLVRIAPHVIDTLFLITGIFLVIASGQYPWNSNWLAAKLCGLVAYIVLGMLAMSVPSRNLRLVAFISAVSVFAWVVSAALLKSPWGFVR